jgi:drug/metabolite transporter (DMT)-like permease
MRFSPPVLAFIAIFILSVMDALIKGASAEFGTMQVVFLRFFVGALVVGVVFALHFPGWPSLEALRVNGLRGFLVVFTAITFFYGLAVLPLAEALALSFLSPIFIAMLGAVLLKEKLGPNILLGLAFGTIGMLVMVFGLRSDPSAQRPLLGIIAATASAFSYALAIVLLRARATKDPVATIVLVQHVVPAAIAGLLVLALWLFVLPGMAAPPKAIALIPVTLDWWFWFLMLGACGAVGHLVLATAFARAEAASLAPIDYTSLIWAVLFGYLFFDEAPGWTTIAGAALIAAGALFASRKAQAASPVEQV